MSLQKRTVLEASECHEVLSRSTILCYGPCQTTALSGTVTSTVQGWSVKQNPPTPPDLAPVPLSTHTPPPSPKEGRSMSRIDLLGPLGRPVAPTRGQSLLFGHFWALLGFRFLLPDFSRNIW